MPWSTIERLALEAGLFPPAARPVSEAELAALLDEALARAMTGRAGGIDDRELDLLRYWRDRYRSGGAAPAWHGCSCKAHPPRVRAAGRLLVGWQELGDPVAGEAGLTWPGGPVAAGELGADATAGGRWWAGFGVRAAGGLAPGTVLPADDPLAWPGWPAATGAHATGRARRQGGGWQADLPRAVGGVSLGRWALAAGWAPRRTGPGLDGGLTLDHGGAAFPALTGRRTAPFRWRGVMRPLAPSDLLLRVGVLSRREVRFNSDAGPVATRQSPWFMEWLVGWRPLPWLRCTATHAVMAASQDGALWPDLLQISFPLVGATWSEAARGPVTDRIFAVGFEARWREAPWPLLPAAAGRVWWEYGGTDFLPSGPGGLLPEIAAPASVVGVALFDPRWDLALEYTELRHDLVLWYSNSGYPDGYTQDGWLLGHALGGSGESLAGTVRIRPAGLGLEGGLTLTRAVWGMPGRTPGDGGRWSLQGTLRGLPSPERPGSLRWTLRAEVRREEARRPDLRPVRRTWGRIWLELGLP